MLNSMDPHADLNTFPMFYDGQANDPGTMALAAAAFIALGIFLGSSLGVSLWWMSR